MKPGQKPVRMTPGILALLAWVDANPDRQSEQMEEPIRRAALVAESMDLLLWRGSLGWSLTDAGRAALAGGRS